MTNRKTVSCLSHSREWDLKIYCLRPWLSARRLKKCTVEVLCFRHHTFLCTYLHDEQRALDIGVKVFLHFLGGGLLKVAEARARCVVNQQVETLRPHDRAHLLGRLFYAVEVINV